MARLPDQLTTIKAIDAAVEAAVEPPRGHLGASMIGKPCDRSLWYGFRWAHAAGWGGRMLRLFDRGRREEAVFAELLRGAGVKVMLHDQATGQQLSYSDLGGHYAGSIDGMVQGLVEAPGTWHVLECKTHGAKSFALLTKDGVEKSKPEHFVQCQVYMAWAKLDRAYYLAVNKDTDELYGERIRADRSVAAKALERAERIIKATEPPARISNDPAWWQCKTCSFRTLCHERKVAAVNCRTCLHATPELEGSARWSCAHWQAQEIPLEGQRAACDEHRFIPALVPMGEVVDAAERVYSWQEFANGTRHIRREAAGIFLDWAPQSERTIALADAHGFDNVVRYRLSDGREFSNGPAGQDSFTSRELSANGHAIGTMLGPVVTALREAFA